MKKEKLKSQIRDILKEYMLNEQRSLAGYSESEIERMRDAIMNSDLNDDIKGWWWTFVGLLLTTWDRGEEPVGPPSGNSPGRLQMKQQGITEQGPRPGEPTPSRAEISKLVDFISNNYTPQPKGWWNYLWYEVIYEIADKMIITPLYNMSNLGGLNEEFINEDTGEVIVREQITPYPGPHGHLDTIDQLQGTGGSTSGGGTSTSSVFSTLGNPETIEEFMSAYSNIYNCGIRNGVKIPNNYSPRNIQRRLGSNVKPNDPPEHPIVWWILRGVFWDALISMEGCPD